MLEQTNEGELVHDPAQLQEVGCRLAGNRWTKAKRTCLALYEAKIAQSYDHRAASVKLAAGNWVRQGQTEETTLVEHQNPEFVAQPRWWADEAAVLARLNAKHDRGFIGFKDITSA